MIAGAPPNPALLQAFSASLTPYLGAAVGDDNGTAGFLPLDGLGSPMRRTTALFAAMTHSLDADREFTGAAGDRAATYERAFAKAAAAEPVSADAPEPKRNLLQAARLRSLVATGAYVADPKAAKPSASHAQTQVAYEVASLTIRVGDPTVDPRYFDAARPTPVSRRDPRSRLEPLRQPIDRIPRVVPPDLPRDPSVRWDVSNNRAAVSTPATRIHPRRSSVHGRFGPVDPGAGQSASWRSQHDRVLQLAGVGQRGFDLKAFYDGFQKAAGLG